MDYLIALQSLNFWQACLIIITAGLALKFVLELLNWFAEKFGIENKHVRKLKEDHDLLIQTSENFNTFMKETQNCITGLTSKVDQFQDNQVIYHQQSIDIRQELADSIATMAKSDTVRDIQIEALMSGTKELLGEAIDQRFEKYVTLNGIPQNDIEEFESLYQTYHVQLNGNGARQANMNMLKTIFRLFHVRLNWSLANMMAAQGYKVGILDADITGPSIPKMYGIHGPAELENECIKPILTGNGIKVMSINLLLPNEEAPVIWRGPVLANMVKQFWSDVIWGELDFLFVDMSPGTGDVPLTVFQSIPVDGIIMVTSPQDLVRLIVKKALNMADSMHIPVLGLIENYSYVVCPDCGKEFKIFGDSEIDKLGEELNLPVLGKMPIDTKLAELADGSFHLAETRLMFL